MLNAILNGALGEDSSRSGNSSSSRSGTSETTYSISTPSGTYTGLTLDQYNQAKYVLNKYYDAYGIAYAYDLPEPDFKIFTAANAQSIVDDYAKRAVESGKTSKSESTAALAQERYALTVAQTEPQQEPQQQPGTTPKQPEVVIPETVVPSGRTDTNESRSGSNTNRASVAPSEEKGRSGLLIPGIILALGVIGAIALTSKSKKRR